MKPLALFLILSGLGIGAASATDGSKHVGISLYMAENSQPAADAKVANGTLKHRLHAVFGFNNYELLQGDDMALAEDGVHWFVPRKDFFISIRPLHRSPLDQTVDYEIYQDGFMVAKGRYELHHDTPLFINGPDLNEGRLIFVVDPKW